MTSEAPIVKLANDIARQFAHLPDDQAAAVVAGHIGRFWEMRMKVELRARGLSHDPGLTPVAAAAARHLAAGQLDADAPGTPLPPLPS